MAKLPFDPSKDFSPVVMVSYSPHVLAAHPAQPFNSVPELIAFAKANPGKLNFAVSGIGGAPQLAGIEFAQRTGVNWTYIPYKGGADAVTAYERATDALLRYSPAVIDGTTELVEHHPQAPMGMRSVIELIEELALRGGGRGLFAGCAAGDSAMALAIEVGDRN